jgi:uncharacterized protein YicC (UPF0701 family)
LIDVETSLTGESSVLPAASDIAEIMLGKSHAKELRKILLADTTVGRKISIISEEVRS